MASETASHPQHDYRPGDVIADRYVLQRRLGEGGMGVVWVAQSTALDVQVALKVLRPELAGTPAVDRMAREARVAAQLGHPALVRVLDFGTSQHGEPYLAMELLEGEELHARLAREKRIAAETAVALLLPIIDGLGTAHNKGIVHRDIKPENIFIAQDGQGRVQPKVLDFGIAKLDHDEGPSRLTQVGAVMGSPFYLSPEQAEGLDDIDFRSDVWAIGVVLYEMVVGAPPFEAPNYNALIRRILRDKPTPITARAAGDEQLWTIIERCLRKDREERWGTMWELGEALALWAFERGVRVDAAARSLRHGWLEGNVTGLQILVASDAPGSSSWPPPARSAVVEPEPDSSIEPLARTQVRPTRRRSSKLLLLGAALVALIGLALAWSQRGRWQALPTVAEPPKSAAPAVISDPAEVSPVEAVPSPEMPEPPSLPASAPSAEPAATGAVAPSRPPVKRAPATRKPAASAPTASARPRAPKAENTEFGF